MNKVRATLLLAGCSSIEAGRGSGGRGLPCQPRGDAPGDGGQALETRGPGGPPYTVYSQREPSDLSTSVTAALFLSLPSPIWSGDSHATTVPKQAGMSNSIKSTNSAKWALCPCDRLNEELDWGRAGEQWELGKGGGATLI
ncbi:hypothetical protein DPEC_G00007720 [Dallia pectoralis]|uniref:Uncharacterized protein n=1 Tax=Dallia pectoralis TaxID=75939 RepID=A0ACC2HL73_DALPE|nr:hypothetical protein DPEC_G00007720 [Dallia pectoralis]